MTREEAIEIIKRNCTSGSDLRKACELFIPELTENEDERIREELIGHCKDLVRMNKDDKVMLSIYEPWLAWLEKQKEQKPELPKPHKGDDNNPYDMQASEALEYAIKRGFGVPFNDGEVYVDVRHMTQTIGNIIRWADEHPKEQKPAVEQQGGTFNSYDMAKTFAEGQYYVMKHPEKFCLCKPTEWSEFDIGVLKDAICATDMLGNDESFNKGNPNLGKAFRVAKDWLKSLPERFNLQPKQEWSEEDEKILNELLDYCNTANATWYNWLKFLCPPHKDKEMKLKILKYLSTRCSSLEFEEVENYLNNLRPSWRPSKEQIGALNYAYCELFKRKDVGHNILCHLQKLIDQLMEQM